MIPLKDQIKCIGRELGLRRNVYKKWIDQGRIKEEDAEHEISCMEAAYETLKELEKKNENLL